MAHDGHDDHHHPHDHHVQHHHGELPEPQALARGAGAGEVLFLDAFSGIAGDMLVSALVQLGVPKAELTAALAGLDLGNYELKFSARTRSGIVARHLEVVVDAAQPARDHRTIRAMIEKAQTLTAGARTLAMGAFQRLAEAEAEVHGTTPDEVHFHEVGAVDSIVDIVAASVALDYLGATVVCSPLPMGRGTIKCQHGSIPGPAPATVRCLVGVPTHDSGLDQELVTPTGACLVAVAASRFARWPSFSPVRVAWGAGTRELPDRPNLLRVVLGQEVEAAAIDQCTHVVIEANVDDLTGELAAVALEKALEAGALDTWSTPIGMKKGRPALMLCALTTAPTASVVANALLSESTSLGVRITPVSRLERPRKFVQVTTEYGSITVKVAEGDGLPPNIAPEYESCRAAAETHGVPTKLVYTRALKAYLDQA